ncbi:MAG: DNA-binding protein [Pseudomonadota bacterium]
MRELQVQQVSDLMTPKQCAEYLNRSEEVLYVWRRERNEGQESGPPFLHITSKTILYDREDVLAWARSHRIN